MAFNLIGIMKAAKEARIDPGVIPYIIAKDEESHRKESKREGRQRDRS